MGINVVESGQEVDITHKCIYTGCGIFGLPSVLGIC